MRSALTRGALAVAGAAVFTVLAASGAAADDQSVYCVYVPDVYTGGGPRPMTTDEDLCIPWTS